MTSDALPSNVPETTALPLLAGRFHVLEKLGEGGMGAVFKARDVNLERLVALKVLPPGKLADADAVARFRREAMAMARLSHPGIVQAHDSGQDGGQHFLVMELVEGHSLARELADKGHLPPTRAADFAHQAALALAHAHAHGLIHRDVKPSNLLLTADGRVKLLDLGLARFLQDQLGDASLTHTGTGMGTPDYAAPEQFRDAHKADARSDVYALGCTLYHLVAGRVPFPGSSMSEKVRAHETKEPEPLEALCPEVPGGLALAVGRMMAKRPADRFQSMAEVAEALAPYVAASSASFPVIRQSSTWDGSRLATLPATPPRRKRGLRIVVGAAVALLAAAGLVALGYALSGKRGEPVAQGTEQGPPDSPPVPDDGGKKEAPAKPDDHPDVLIVSQKPEGGGKYRTLSEALADVKAGQTIRVLDDATYSEVLVMRSATRFENVTLEAPRRATLQPPRAPAYPIIIDNVSGLTIRGFRIKDTRPEGEHVLTAHGRVGGLVLEDLEFQLAPQESQSGLSVEGVELGPGQPPVVVRGCTFTGQGYAVRVSGMSAPCAGVVVADNVFRDVRIGIGVFGRASRVHVAANRFVGAVYCGVLVKDVGEQAEDLAIVNNTFCECFEGLRLIDTQVRGRHLRFCNNLVLGGGRIDLVYLHPAGGGKLRPADGREVGAVWQFAANWREGPVPVSDLQRRAAWIPPGEKDVRKEKIEGVRRDPKDPDFLRPEAKSDLATRGAGTEDPSLPGYVGALPPEGSDAWDWERAWRVSRGARVLTVSKSPKDKAKYDSLGAALNDARPWDTIRVLDAATYAEALLLNDPSRHEGVSLESPLGATLQIGAGQRRALAIVGVPHVRVQGLRFCEDGAGPGTAFVSVTRHAPGVVLDALDLRGGDNVDGVVVSTPLDAGEPPVVLRRCAVEVGYDGILLIGPVNPAPGTPPLRNVIVRDCRVRGGYRGVKVQGAAEDVHVAGNVVWDSKEAALQVQDLPAGSRGLLFANNTAFQAGTLFRVWDDPPYEKLEARQVEVGNNLLFEEVDGDVLYLVRKSAEEFVPGDLTALDRLWPFHHNGREGTGNEAALSLAPTDLRLEKIELLSRDADSADFARPPAGSRLATAGAGPDDPSLPAYVGAVPPRGVAPWDWDRTWRARTKKTPADKK
jgi:serine/threonine protein kinase